MLVLVGKPIFKQPIFVYARLCLDSSVSRRFFAAEAQFNSSAVRMGFLVSEVTLGRIFHRALRFPLLIAILPMLHTRLSSGARTLYLLEAAVPRDCTAPSTAT